MTAARHAAPTPTIGGREKLRGAGALLLLLVLVVGIPAVLIAAAGVPFTHGLSTWPQLIDRLRAPDDGQLLLDLLLMLAWAGWTAFTVSVAVEMIALARRTVAPALFGLGVLQPAVGRLLASAALLLPASGAVLHLGAGPVHPPPAVAAPLRPAAATSPANGLQTAHRPQTATPQTVQPVLAAVVLPVYVVGTDRTGARDTLWSIAARHLGDPMRWHDIARLNNGRIQADGGVFTDPNLIRPGWTLQLPSDATGLTPPTAPATPSSTLPAPETPRTPAPSRHVAALPSLAPVPPPVVAPPAAPTSAGTSGANAAPTQNSEPAQRTTPATATPDPATSTLPARQRGGRWSVPLGAGSDISAVLAAAILLLLSVRRLRRRRHYQPRPPQPATFTGHEPLPPPLRQLIAQTPETASAGAVPADVFLAAVTAGRQWELGVDTDGPVTVSWTECPVLALTGEGAADTARALIAAALLEAPGTIDVVAAGSIVGELLPGLGSDAHLNQRANLSAAAEQLQLEVLSRSRRLADADLPDAAAYRTTHPEDPFPGLLFVADQPLDVHPALARLLATNAQLDIAALLLTNPNDPTLETAATVEVLADGTAGSVDPPALAGRLDGAALYRLTAEDAAGLLGAPLPAVHVDDRASAAAHSTARAPAVPAADNVDWPAAAPPAPEAGRPPIRVQLLGNGPMRIWMHEVEITVGLRGSARQLLAWYLLHPEGRTLDTAVTALWPDIEPQRASQHFWTALGNLRSRLADSDGNKPLVLAKTAGAYRPEPGAFTVDLWTFQAALQLAAAAADDAEKISQLRQAIEAYRGPFAVDTDYLWADPIREELHRRALDAHVAYAEILAAHDEQERAIAALERALELDPHAEDVYRRLMRLHHDAGRKESIRLLWKQLNVRLADIDAEPDPETTRLYRRIRGLESGQQRN